MGKPDTMNMNAKFFVLKQQDESKAQADDHFALAAQVAADQYNLQGEGPKGGAPVEIGITPPVGNRKVLINLATQLPDYIRRFNQVFDFVPVEPVAKQAARERFKKLRQLGANLTTQDINSQPLWQTNQLI